jgi:phage gpG-like protein
MVVAKTLRFIDGNFRAQGWQGATFKSWQPIKRKGTILVHRGALRRSPNGTIGRGYARIYTNVVYADLHNRGGTINTTASVKAFSRRRFFTDEVSAPGARKPKFVRTQTGESEVKAHTRKMKLVMPQRQFMPYEGHGSPVLDASIKRELDKQFKSILTL